jgi:hypothetical protein
MKRLYLLYILTLPLLVMTLHGQEPEPAKPATKLEVFQAKTGVLIVRGYTTIGTISGMGGNITVDAREFKDAGNPALRSTGVSIAVKESGRLERESTAFIDSDEIQSLLSGIDYIAKATPDVTSLSNFEVEYRTKGDFRVTVFNDSSGHLSVVVSAGRIGKVSTYLSLQELQELRNLIVAARGKVWLEPLK